ncbi:geranylgeranyl reductase family protein [Roseinatronobacter alkalisoli]|uniref:geranylgeranyl reductase family protein n=1 Tax=Roseinatronobacter alkalisoli TaxID=3028235 RepID=UPI002367596E|nr:geranylgeranyl reductase family protein [Roseinatronobacter sp. HJB301]
MKHSFDVLVLGSGPAGSAAAITAARSGLSVALIDKSAFPREKLCGGGITGRSARYMAEIFELCPDRNLFLGSTRFRLAFEGSTIGEMADAPVLQMTMRREFDAELHRRAVAAGAQVFAPVKVSTINTETPSLTLADGRILSSRILIGADGANSAVARSLYGRAFDPAEIGFGLEVELDRSLTDDNTVEIDLGAAPWGYGWKFPKNDSITLGVGGLHAKNPDMQAYFRKYLALHAPHLRDKSRIRCKGAFLPFGAYRKVPGRGPVLLVGDAAGLVDPITGEGIAWAMRSGQFAGEVAVRTLQTNTRPMDAYMERLRYIHREIAVARRIRMLIYATPVRRYFPRTVERNPSMTRSYLRLLSGEVDYHDLGHKVLWRIARQLGVAALGR